MTTTLTRKSLGNLAMIPCPCDYCETTERCKTQLLACKIFYLFAKSGKGFKKFDRREDGEIVEFNASAITDDDMFDLSHPQIVKLTTPIRKYYINLYELGK